MAMSPRVRKLALTAHLTSSVGWIGAAAAYLAIAIAAVVSTDIQLVRGAYLAMELTGWYVIVPLAVTSLLTGLVMALGTRWGLFRHYWVLFSLGLTLFATYFLLQHMPTVTSLADTARQADERTLLHLRGDILHPAIGLAVLLVIQGLNVFKPRGMTRYGYRKLHGQRPATPRTDGDEPARAPVLARSSSPES